MADKIDFKKTIDAYRAQRGHFRVVDVPQLQYLMIDGHGDPNGAPAFARAIETLYPLAYTLKFASKRELGRDYVVPPLEGLWWSDDMRSFTTARDKARWRWTLLLMTPDWIDDQRFVDAVALVRSKSPSLALALDSVRLAPLSEGRCVQTLHVGSFDDESEVLAELHERFIPAHGFRMVGKHHEIYLSDFRKVPPDRQRTILRQPVGD